MAMGIGSASSVRVKDAAEVPRSRFRGNFKAILRRSRRYPANFRYLPRIRRAISYLFARGRRGERRAGMRATAERIPPNGRVPSEGSWRGVHANPVRAMAARITARPDDGRACARVHT